jgi:SpoVK/Ycf46/Vps4 family AAA+-type ATPase
LIPHCFQEKQRKHHEESLAKQRKQHEESLAKQRKEHEESLAKQRREYEELLNKQRRQAELLAKQRREYGVLIEPNNLTDMETQILSSKNLHIGQPNVQWEKVGGRKFIKEFFLNSILEPLKEGKPSKCSSVLLRGKTGAGKTFMAHAVRTYAISNNINCVFINMQAVCSNPESASLIPAIFSLATKLAPCIIVFEEAG